MRKLRKIGTVLLYTALTLFLLTLLSAHMLSGMLARYVTGDEGGDSARAAAWDPKLTVSADDVTNTAGSDDSQYTEFEVNAGGSEVALSYDVILTLLRDGEPIDWPAGAAESKLKGDGETAKVTAKITSENGTTIATSENGVFENLGTMSPGDPAVKRRAYIMANEATVGGDYTLEVTVRFEQTD